MKTDIKIGESKASYITRVSVHSSTEELADALFEKTKEHDSLLNDIDEINESSVAKEKNLEIKKISLLLSEEVEKITALSSKNKRLESKIGTLEFEIKNLKKSENEIFKKYTSGQLFKEMEKRYQRKNTLQEYEIRDQEKLIKDLQEKLKNSISIHELSKNKEYANYFFIQAEELLHELNLKPGIRSALSELIAKYKKINSHSAAEDLLSELFKKFGYLT